MTEKNIQLSGLGSALIDVFLELSEDQFNSLGFEKGSMRWVDPSEQAQLLAQFGGDQLRMASGGSVANSIIGFAQLGGKAALNSCIANDTYGSFYREEFKKLGIELPVAPVVGKGDSGTVVALITPDAERTMRTSFGVNGLTSPEYVSEDMIKRSQYLLIEGYVFSIPGGGIPAIERAVALAKQHGTKLTLTCSEAFVVNDFREAVKKVVADCEVVFCNEEESFALSGKNSAQEAGRALCDKIPTIIVTAGSKGAYVWNQGKEIHVPAFPCKPKDLTGAGDMFAGSFLYGIINGHSLEESARNACFLAKAVITQVGARLHGDVKSKWGKFD